MCAISAMCIFFGGGGARKVSFLVICSIFLCNVCNFCYVHYFFGGEEIFFSSDM